MATPFTLAQIDHALEWVLRDAAVAAGYWPDVRALLAAGKSGADLAAAKAAILTAGGALVEVLGVAPWEDRGELRGNNVVLSRLTTGRGSYASGDSRAFEQLDPADRRAGYRELLLPREPQSITYEVRFVTDSSGMDRAGTELVLACFALPTYCRGLNDDLSLTAGGFEVRPLGPSQDLSSGKYVERLWRIQVLDVQLVPARVLDGAVPAATDLGVNLGLPGGESAAAAYPLD